MLSLQFNSWWTTRFGWNCWFVNIGQFFTHVVLIFITEQEKNILAFTVMNHQGKKDDWMFSVLSRKCTKRMTSTKANREVFVVNVEQENFFCQKKYYWQVIGMEDFFFFIFFLAFVTSNVIFFIRTFNTSIDW